MAFHPFKHFRKHQKKYLVVVTIMTMVIFVASFGAGDLFTTLQRRFALTASRGEKVLNLYGKTLRTEELERLRWHRQLASEFLLYDVSLNLEIPLSKSLANIQRKYIQKKGANDLPTPVQIAFQQMEQYIQLAMRSTPDMQLQPLKNGLAYIQDQLSKTDGQKNPDQYHALDTLATNLALQSWAIERQRLQRPDESYFGGSLKPEELLDFLVWKQQADRLGIVLTPADVSREVNRAWGYGDYLSADGKFENNEYVVAFFRSNSKIHKSLTARDLMGALTDEFRVLLAKAALIGSASGVRGYREAVDGIHISPAAATPDEFYKYFQEQRTTLSVSMLPVPVESFVAEAKKKAKPTETDLRNLYARYKDDEPSPTRRQPGFKEPRRIKVEYFSYEPEGPFARQLAAKAIELLPIFRVGQPAAPFAAGGGMAWAASMAGYADLDAAVRSLYESYRDEESRRRPVKYDLGDNTCFGLSVDLFDPRAVEAQAAAVMVGELVGDLGSGGTTLAAPIGWLAVNEAAERATLTAYASAVLAAPSSSRIAAAVLPMRYRHTPQPLDAVREQMIDRLQSTMARTIMEGRPGTVDKSAGKIPELRKELDKVLGSHSGEKLAELMKKAAAESGIDNVHIMKESQTQQEIVDNPDPVLKKLEQAYYESSENPFAPPFLFGPQEMRPDFVSALFHSFEPANQDERQIYEALKRPLRTRQFHTLTSDRGWVFWRVEDKSAHARPFEQIRAEVETAWYFEQARKLAREKAQQINRELKDQKLASPEAEIQFLVQQGLGSVFQLKQISHLTTPEFIQPGGSKFHGRYRQYVAPKEFVPYPPADFVDQLLKLRQRGESLVLADKPVKHFYVAVLMEDPQLPQRSEFYEVYNLPNQDTRNLFSTQDEPLWYQMMADRQRKYARKLLEQLRVEATPDLQGGEYVLPDNVRNRGESSRDFGE